MLFAKDRREFSSRRAHVHNLNLGKIPAISEAVPELPFEIITEILSWLPVKSLLRFKIVCKQWRSLHLDYKFIKKHMFRASPLELSYQPVWKPNNKQGALVRRYDDNFNCVTKSVAGLFLERSRTDRQLLRIRNFATRQVLYLPKEPNAIHGVMGFAFDSSTGEFKVAYLYNNEDGEVAGFKVLSIGRDDEWRTHKLPNKYQREARTRQRRYFKAVRDERLAHMTGLIKVGGDLKIQVVSFDIWSECFTITTVPAQGVFTHLRRVFIIPWIKTIAVVDMVEEALNVLMLQDLKEQKWSKITVPLKFLKDDPVLKNEIRPCYATKFELKFNNFVRDEVLVYDMKLERIKATRPKSVVRSISSVKPSLITLKGMVEEDSVPLTCGTTFTGQEGKGCMCARSHRL